MRKPGYNLVLEILEKELHGRQKLIEWIASGRYVGKESEKSAASRLEFSNECVQQLTSAIEHLTRNEPAMEKEIEKLAEEYALKNAIGVIDGLGLNEAFIAGFKAGLTRLRTKIK